MNRAMTHGFVVAMLGALASVSVHAASINSIYDMDRMLSEPHPLAGQYGTRWNPATVATRSVIAIVPVTISVALTMARISGRGV